MKLFIQLSVRGCFIGIWFAFGYFFNSDIISGMLSSICAFILMEIFYYVDKRTGGYDNILNRLDFIEETIEGAQENRKLIIDELIIREQDAASYTEDYYRGRNVAFIEAQEIVNRRFNRVFTKLKDEKSTLK